MYKDNEGDAFGLHEQSEINHPEWKATGLGLTLNAFRLWLQVSTFLWCRFIDSCLNAFRGTDQNPFSLFYLYTGEIELQIWQETSKGVHHQRGERNH